MKKLLLSLALASSCAYAAGIEHGKYINIYQADTYKVKMLRYGAEADSQYLIKVTGIDNAQDGKIYLHTKKCDDTKCSTYKYVTTQVHKPDGKQWFTIYNPGGWYNGDILQPYLVEPDKEKRLYLSKSVQTISGIEVQDFIDEYNKQQAKK